MLAPNCSDMDNMLMRRLYKLQNMMMDLGHDSHLIVLVNGGHLMIFQSLHFCAF
jgi:hypothetical protein